MARAAGDEARDGCRACILEGSCLSPGAWAFRGRGGTVIGGLLASGWLEVTGCMEDGEEQDRVYRDQLRGTFCENVDDK